MLKFTLYKSNIFLIHMYVFLMYCAFVHFKLFSKCNSKEILFGLFGDQKENVCSIE